MVRHFLEVLPGCQDAGHAVGLRDQDGEGPFLRRQNLYNAAPTDKANGLWPVEPRHTAELGCVFKARLDGLEPPGGGARSQPSRPFLDVFDSTRGLDPGPKTPAAWV